MSERVFTTAKSPESEKKCSSSCKKKLSFDSSGSSADRILQLQRTAGNQAVQRLIKSGALQAKLKIGQPNDIYEQEADRVAEQVMRMPDSIIRPKLECPLGKGTSCKIDKEIKLRGKKTIKNEAQVPALNSQVPPIVHEILRSPGQPLDKATSSLMGSHFGTDFSHVRIHTDPKAAESTQTLGAEAFTLGHNIVFNVSRYSPETSEGKRLLAHELAHVVQQQSANMSSDFEITSEPESPLEIEAEYASNKIMQNQKANITQRSTNITPQPGIVGCMWHMWRFSNIITECRKEYEENCKEDLSDKCQKFMSGSGNPSDSIYKCVGRKNPKAMAKLLSSCSTVSLGHVLKGPRASNEISTAEPSEAVASREGSEDEMATSEV